MGLFDSLVSLRSARHIHALAEELTQKVWPFVWRRVEERAPQLSPAQARGYVRTHAGAFVRSSAAAALRGHEALGLWATDAVVEQCLELVVRRAIEGAIRVQRERLQAERFAAKAA